MKATNLLIDTLVRRSFWTEIFTELVKIIRLHAIFVFIISFYICLLVIATVLLNVEDKISFSLYNNIIPLTITLYFLVFLISHSIYVMILIRPKKLIIYIFNDLQTNYLKRKRLLNALPIILFLSLFMSAFTVFKNIIPIMNPYSWDPKFAKIDVMIHGGYQAWQLLQPIFGYPLLTSIINFFYNLWIFVMLFVLYWQAFSLSNLKLRMQFFISFVLAWAVLGTGLATLFSSAGPCYYDKIVMSNDIYQPLMKYLNNAQKFFPIWALNTQEMLWKSYESNKIGLGSGISAMPSMHLSTSILFTLVGWRSNRLLGVLFSIFAVVIMLGSVLLAWHYAIDGYAAILFTLLIWYTVGISLKNTTNVGAHIDKDKGQTQKSNFT